MYCALCAVYCVLCTVYCALCPVYCVLCTVYGVLCTCGFLEMSWKKEKTYGSSSSLITWGSVLMHVAYIQRTKSLALSAMFRTALVSS